MTLTTHRIVYVQSGSSKGLALRLHYLVYLEEEKSSGFGFSKSKKLMLHLSEPLPGILFYFSINSLVIHAQEHLD
jgi:Vacuolar protein sorting protein 36 Vps36